MNFLSSVPMVKRPLPLVPTTLGQMMFEDHPGARQTFVARGLTRDDTEPLLGEKAVVGKIEEPRRAFGGEGTPAARREADQAVGSLGGERGVRVPRSVDVAEVADVANGLRVERQPASRDDISLHGAIDLLHPPESALNTE